MSKLAALGLASICLVPALQERVKPKEPADFPGVLAKVASAWEEERYGTCVQELQSCLEMAVRRRSASIRAALPDAPEGYQAQEDRAQEAAAQNPFAAAMASSIGNIIEKSYRQEGGAGRIQVTVTADSPLVSMLGMMLANPASVDGELIKYGSDKAVLKQDARGLNLQIVIGDAHVVDVTWSGGSEDQLFALFDQAAVDRLSRALSR